MNKKHWVKLYLLAFCIVSSLFTSIYSITVDWWLSAGVSLFATFVSYRKYYEVSREGISHEEETNLV